MRGMGITLDEVRRMAALQRQVAKSLKQALSARRRLLALASASGDATLQASVAAYLTAVVADAMEMPAAFTALPMDVKQHSPATAETVTETEQGG